MTKRHNRLNQKRTHGDVRAGGDNGKRTRFGVVKGSNAEMRSQA